MFLRENLDGDSAFANGFSDIDFITDGVMNVSYFVNFDFIPSNEASRVRRTDSYLGLRVISICEACCAGLSQCYKLLTYKSIS